MNDIICSKCVLDTDTPYSNLEFDESGICNNCNRYEDTAKKTIQRDENIKETELNSIIARIKKEGRKKKYDCIIGVSGGVDSTYLAYLAKKYELKPLIVHFDNGWNSEAAVSNIFNIIQKLGFELHTYVVNWEEFKDLQLSYLKASVIDIEVPTDHFIIGTLYEVAYQNRIKYILDGINIETEFSDISLKWGYNKVDLVNIQNIHNKFGKITLKKYPKIGQLQRFFYTEIYGLKAISILNYVSYNKKKVKDTISIELDWRDYGGKHYESIFTRFYQGVILPNKFKIDKRKLHLSNLIWSKQIKRMEALEELSTPTYPLDLQEKDKKYFLSKMGMNDLEYENIMNSKPVPHEFYGTEKSTFLYFILSQLNKKRLLIKGMRFLFKIWLLIIDKFRKN